MFQELNNEPQKQEVKLTKNSSPSKIGRELGEEVKHEEKKQNHLEKLSNAAFKWLESNLLHRDGDHIVRENGNS